MTMGAPDIALQRKKALRSPKRTVAGGVITHRSGERLQPRIPEASPAPAQPSPTLLSIQKLMAKQAAFVGALQETGRAQAVAEALEAPSEPAGPSSVTICLLLRWMYMVEICCTSCLIRGHAFSCARYISARELINKLCKMQAKVLETAPA